MATTQYLNSLKRSKLYVLADYNPWAGVSLNDINFIDSLRVDNINITAGSGFDSAELVYSQDNDSGIPDDLEDRFGLDFNFFQPIRIVSVEDSDSNQEQTTVFRGFITKDTQVLTQNNETITFTALDYKWLLSKRTKIRGKWYSNEGTPNELGSGLSVGDAKFNYEKFRGSISDLSGYLQNEECVFNENGKPDCYVDNQASSIQAVFYKDDVSFDERQGMANDVYIAKEVEGYYWTWATILRHIEKYWIEPYNASAAGIKIHSGDMSIISDIDENLSKPLNFSIDGYNPLTAIDTVVRNLPGKWIWYLDYSNSINTVKIRIKKLSLFSFPEMIVSVGEGECITESNANCESVTVSRNSDRAIKNVIARGGKIKLTTTVKLVPLWPTFDGNDFKSSADLLRYKTYLKDVLGKNNKLELSDTTLTKEEILRYAQIYRIYGIPIDGKTFSENIANEGLDQQIISLEGAIGREYSSLFSDIIRESTVGFSTSFFSNDSSSLDDGPNVNEMFFENVRINRGVSPPKFDRYCDQPVIFLYDEINDGKRKIRKGLSGKKSIRNIDGNALITDNIRNDIKWLIPDGDNKIGYSIDQNNGIVTFDLPQFRRSFSSTEPEEIEHITKYVSFLNFNANDDVINEQIGSYLGEPITLNPGYNQGGELNRIQTREVYLTATFDTDISAILSKKVQLGIDDLLEPAIDLFDGPEFSEYIDNNSNDIIIHSNAWYPLQHQNKDLSNPDYITDTMNGHIVGSVIRSAEAFDNYKKYVGHGAFELMRSIESYLSGYTELTEDIELVFPYLELGNILGMKLTNIQGTEYDNIKSNIVKISIDSDSDSDSYKTSYSLSNDYSSDKGNLQFVSDPNKTVACDETKRETLKFINELESVF